MTSSSDGSKIFRMSASAPSIQSDRASSAARPNDVRTENFFLGNECDSSADCQTDLDRRRRTAADKASVFD